MPISPRQVLLLGTFNADGTVTGVTATQSSQAIQADGRGLIVVYFRSVGTTSGGTVLIEEADWGPGEPIYSGTWSTVLSQAASGFSGTAQLAVHASIAAFAWYRVRISSTITGGGTILATSRDMSVAS
jgi:hypothetical protein